MRKLPLASDLDFLREAVSNELIKKEPLAATILLYLSKHEQINYSELMDLFDEKIERIIRDMIKEERANAENSKFENHIL